MTWRSIKDDPPPMDGALHVRGLWVTSNRTGAKWWEAISGHVDDDGDFVDYDENAPWRVDDYTHWMPLPEPPNA